VKTARKHKEDCGVYELILNDELMKIIFTVNNNVIMVLKFFLFFYLKILETVLGLKMSLVRF
jgi:hypothetical protein